MYILYHLCINTTSSSTPDSHLLLTYPPAQCHRYLTPTIKMTCTHSLLPRYSPIKTLLTQSGQSSQCPHTNHLILFTLSLTYQAPGRRVHYHLYIVMSVPAAITQHCLPIIPRCCPVVNSNPCHPESSLPVSQNLTCISPSHCPHLWMKCMFCQYLTLLICLRWDSCEV